MKTQRIRKGFLFKVGTNKWGQRHRLGTATSARHRLINISCILAVFATESGFINQLDRQHIYTLYYFHNGQAQRRLFCTTSNRYGAETTRQIFVPKTP